MVDVEPVCACPQLRPWAARPMTGEPLFVAIGRLLDGKPNDDVVPTLITFLARALAQEANGDLDNLARRLLLACRLIENEAGDMLEKDMLEKFQ
jgi:hypothetical protein